MRKLKTELGVYVFPYINGRLFDYNAPSWNEESFAAVTKTMAPRFCPMSLQPVVDTYGSKQNLAIMCPATKYWQDRVVDMVRKVYDYDADGVYLDQVSASKAVACADSSHHHSVRGGNYWHEGYLDMVQSCNHVAQQRRKAIVTESNMENFLSFFHGHLTLSPYQICNLPPMYLAVYSGFTSTFGRLFSVDDFLSPTAITGKLTQMFIYGTQLGWFSLGGNNDVYDLLIDPANTQVLDFAKLLAKYRTSTLEYLVHGRYMAPLSWVTKPRFGSCYDFEVQSSVWKSQDGSLGIPLVNPNLVSSSVSFRFHPTRYELTEGRNVSVSVISPSGTVKFKKMFPANESIAISEQIPALSVLFLQVKSVEN